VGRETWGVGMRHSQRRYCLAAIAAIALFSVGLVRAADRPWTRSEILAIADQEAKRLGYNIDTMGVSLDAYNSVWSDHLESEAGVRVLDRPSGNFRSLNEEELREMRDELLRDLKDREYWAVYYSPLEAGMRDGDAFIFIDLATGEVIKVLRGE